MRWALLIIAVVLVVTSAFFWGKHRAFERDGQRRLARVEAAARRGPSSEHLAGEALPEPVRRYLEQALPTDGRRIQRLSVRQRGTFNSRDDREEWVPFEARQVVSAHEPAFIWIAEISMGFPVKVVDSYTDGRGVMWGNMLGADVVKEVGGDSMARASLLRYLAEMAWFPTAFAGNPRLQWEPIDDHHARAILRDGSTEVTVDFEFGANGLLAGGRAIRDRGANAVPSRAPWSFSMSDYRSIGGLLIPVKGEVRWELPGRAPLPYWRGELFDFQLTWSTGGVSSPQAVGEIETAY